MSPLQVSVIRGCLGLFYVALDLLHSILLVCVKLPPRDPLQIRITGRQ